LLLPQYSAPVGVLHIEATQLLFTHVLFNISFLIIFIKYNSKSLFYDILLIFRGYKMHDNAINMEVFMGDLEKTDNEIDDKKYSELLNNIETLVNNARKNIAHSISNTMIETYWNIGKYIVEYEQKGNIRAEYGKNLLKNISNDLTLRLGKGFQKSNIYRIRKFYEYFPIFPTSSGKLSWSHISEILGISDELERNFYFAQTLKDKWSIKELRRQINTGLFLRLASNKNKEQILKLSAVGIDEYKKEDVIKDIYTLEFLGLPEKHRESKLEQALIDNLQTFLLELGKGFAFVGRQYRLTVDNEHYYADLVFYHIYLKCYVVIDLKTRKIKPIDISQMNMYLGYFAIDKNTETDNPPIGIILGTNKDETMIKYATYNMDSNLFVSKYELYLPNKEDLKKIVDKTIEEQGENEIKK